MINAEISIPLELLLTDFVNLVENIVISTYPNILENYIDSTFLQSIAILAWTIEVVDEINDCITKLLPSLIFIFLLYYIFLSPILSKFMLTIMFHYLGGAKEFLSCD